MQQDPGLDEVDEFHAGKEQILFDQAGFEEPESEESEQEVLGLDEDDEEEEIERYKRQLTGHVDEEEEDYFGSEQEQEQEEDDVEGWGSRNDYYGGDNVEDQEDAKLMEQEALRIQKKHLEDLHMDDYMVDDDDEDWSKPDKSTEAVAETAKLDESNFPELMETQYPEFIPLLKEVETLTPVLEELDVQKKQSSEAELKFSALSVYLGTITTYFALFGSYLKSGEQFSMREEPIMTGILSAREVWRQAQKKRAKRQHESLVEEAETAPELIDQFDDALSDEEEDSKEVSSDEEEPDVLADRRVRRLRAVGPEELDEVDREEKKGRRRTLRFYTSKIDQQERKKDSKFQGDQDVPYKERLFERRLRLLEEARKRGDRANASAPGLELGAEDPEGDLDGSVANSYYAEVDSSKKSTKQQRKAAHELAKIAARDGKLAEIEETIGDSGKRAVNYQILKNRGLTPHRNKDNRNSRVKKRKKYAQAQKKLKSVRAVYTADRGAYVGETTGIKKNVSKSVKLH
ncbi:hypothetical protein OGAPHI_005170 [Ogataea philodendri]|uniref:Sas10 C-terminal domain-containing protein n=1 Tax=Ogataea philodendri TaxID=1378263 RepID=A0A9P8T2E7_9ASCO|nr:uncharacterized protein OGAPHI_005170 [Ogataea philodendri]KAH3663768.1 hypothetical protein OGAPHI_005170 [Ogataea philodendri]